jgi:hypothetical protein
MAPSVCARLPVLVFVCPQDRLVAPTPEERQVLKDVLQAQLKECNFETFYDVGRSGETTHSPHSPSPRALHVSTPAHESWWH